MKVKTLFRVRFNDKGPKETVEVIVRHVTPSEMPGMVCLREFVFQDAKKKIILPDEDSASKRYRKTQSLHIPYHQIQTIEEIIDEPTDVKNLPFHREVATHELE